MRWVLISAVAFLFAIGASVLFLLSGQRLFLPGTDKSIFYLLILVPLGIASALMLFKVMKSFADYKGKSVNHQLEVSGPAVIFMLIIGTGYYFYRHPPLAEEFTLTIHFLDKGSRSKPLQGSVAIDILSDMRYEKIHDGVVSLPRVRIGSQIKLDPDIRGYVLAENNSFQIDDNNKILEVLMKEKDGFADQKRKIVNRLCSELEIYRINAFNFTQFMELDMINLFDGEKKYYDTLFDRINKYNLSYENLISSKDSLVNQFGDLMGQQKKKELENYFDDFKKGHDAHFRSFNTKLRKKLINYSAVEKVSEGEKTKFVEDAQVCGEQARDWLNNVTKEMESLKQDVSEL